MAKIRGPLFSEHAAGNFASGTMQFRGGLQGTHAYKPRPRKTVNQSPPTPAQETVRTAYKQILTEWRALDEQEKLQWDAAANESGKPLTGWNMYFASRIRDVLDEPSIPSPDTYAAPAGGNVLFPGTVWAVDTNYTPPQGDSITFSP